MKSSSVYRSGKRTIVHPWSKTKTGVLIATEPFTVFSNDVNAGELGEAVLSALAAAQLGLPQPTDWSAVTRGFLQATGSRSWAAFMKGAVSCLIVLKDDGIEIISQTNKGPRGGFQPGPLEPVTLPSTPDASLLGEAVKKTLDSTK